MLRKVLALLLIFSLSLAGTLAMPELCLADAGKKDTAEKDSAEKDSDTKKASKPEKEADKDDDNDDEQAEDKDDDKDAKKPKKKKTKKRKTAKVEKKPLKVELEFDATFVSKTETEVALRPEAWSGYEIVEIVPHGTEVREGQVLVKFDDTKLAREIEELELQQRLDELSLLRDEEALPRIEKSLKMSLVDAERSKDRVHEDYTRYTEEERERSIEAAKMSLKGSKQRLDYAKDELEQLQKMYDADDLTEETEEIVLTRQKQAVEMAEFYYDSAKHYHDLTMQVFLPRRDIDIKETVDRVDLSLKRAQASSKYDATRARYELEQRRQRRAKSIERHAKLLADRDLMTIKAPAAGLVYYGRSGGGRWSEISSLKSKLVPHGKVSSGTVMMTIVDPAEMHLVGSVGESAVPDLASGQDAKVHPVSDDVPALEASVKSISRAPISSGKFEVTLTLGSDEAPEWLVPGMSGEVEVVTYMKKDALIIPEDALQTEEDDEDAHYVWLLDSDADDAKAKKQPIEVGKEKKDDVEILSGLKAGDLISLEDEEKRAEEAAKEKEEDEADSKDAEEDKE